MILLPKVSDIKGVHCLTKMVLETRSLPQLREVLEAGGDATVSRSGRRVGDADGLDDRTEAGSNSRTGSRVRTGTQEAKGEIPHSLVRLTAYNRSHAARILRQRAREAGNGCGHIGAVRPSRIGVAHAPQKKRRNRPRRYEEEALVPLQQMWVICGGEALAVGSTIGFPAVTGTPPAR